MFVAFEGGEGSGKSTQLARLAQALRAAGRSVVVTLEPGGTDIGQRIRELVLHHRAPLTARAEALLFAADRAQHVDTVVRPALTAGRDVLTDRYVDSSLAYQGSGRQLSVEEIAGLSRWATGGLVPDVTVLLDLPARDGLLRAGGRGGLDKLENESLEFHERVRQAFLDRAAEAPERYLVLDGRRAPDELASLVYDAVASR